MRGRIIADGSTKTVDGRRRSAGGFSIAPRLAAVTGYGVAVAALLIRTHPTAPVDEPVPELP